MKKTNIHPTLNHVIFVDIVTGDEFPTRSTLSSQARKALGGQDFHVVPMDVTAASHPFYTGQRRLCDSEGRLERFRRRYART